MATIERFEDIAVWQQSRVFAKEIFEITEDGKFLKDFRFRGQIRSSAGSVMDNIAEGYERRRRIY